MPKIKESVNSEAGFDLSTTFHVGSYFNHVEG